jgi:hypothetical protein
MNTRSIQAAAIMLALSATAAMASAQTTTGTSGAAGAGGGSMPNTTMHSGNAMSSPMPSKTTKKSTSKKNLARHGPPIDAAGANGGGTSHPESGTDVPSTSGMSSSSGSGK